MGIKRGCALETYYLSPITYYAIILSPPRILASSHPQQFSVFNFQFSVLQIIIHLLLAEIDASEGADAGDTVAEGELRRNIEPLRCTRIVHPRI